MSVVGRESTHTHDRLTIDAQDVTAGGQHAQAGAAAQQRCDERHAGVANVFTVVQHEEQVLVPQGVDQG